MLVARLRCGLSSSRRSRFRNFRLYGYEAFGIVQLVSDLSFGLGMFGIAGLVPVAISLLSHVSSLSISIVRGALMEQRTQW